MDENNTLQDFVNNVLGVSTPQVLNKILIFVNNFSEFMGVMDKETELFVKEIHSSNSAKPPNEKILIQLNAPQ